MTRETCLLVSTSVPPHSTRLCFSRRFSLFVCIQSHISTVILLRDAPAVSSSSFYLLPPIECRLLITSLSLESAQDLTVFVQNLLEQMQQRFNQMSSSIIGRIDEMG
jgi:hypothetical protein